MEGTKNRYRTTSIHDVMEIDRNPSCGFDPEPVSIPHKFTEACKKWSTYPAIVSKEGKIYAYGDYYANSEQFARALLAIGLQPLDVVCAIGYTSPEYAFTLQGSWLAGCVTSGIYTTNSADACEYVLQHADAKVCVCQGGINATKIASIRENLPNLKAIVVYWPEEGVPSIPLDDGYATIYTWKTFLNLGNQVFGKQIKERYDAIQPGNCATLIYTSGTTGVPKGVMISHDNVVFNTETCRQSFELNDNDRVVSFLPMNHIAAQFFDVMLPISNRITVYMAKPDALQGSLNETLRVAKPTLFLAVPRIWEKFAESIVAEMQNYSWCKSLFIKWARKIGTKACTSRQFGHKHSLPFMYPLANHFCFSKIREKLGLECCHTCIVSAAPISDETLVFFNSFDLPILDLWGQSESTGPVACNSHYNHQYKLFTSGLPFPGIQCRVDPNTKELQYKGRVNMMGYLKMERETYYTIDDEGWIHTGDQAMIDKDGYIKIIGRLKELIVTAGGENICPTPIEQKILELCPALSNCVLIGDKRKFLSCLISLKTVINPLTGEPTNRLTDTCIKELNKYNINVKTVEEAKENVLVKQMIDNTIKKYNANAISRAQNIRKWILLDHDLSLSTGELTPTLKLRRNVVQNNYEHKINALYQ